MVLSLPARTLLRWSWLIVFLSVTAGATAFFGSQMLPKQYDSEAQVLVGALTTVNNDQLLAYQQLAQTYAEIATTTPVLTRVIDKLSLPDQATQLASRIDVRALVGESIVKVVATASSPLQASQLANAVADEITTMGRSAVDQPSLATVVQSALPPDHPSSPRVLLNTAIAAALGFVLGVGVALLVGNRARVSDAVPDERAKAAS